MGIDNKERLMGYFANLELEIMEMAHDMGDDFGDDAQTATTIARCLGITAVEVQRVLSADYDEDPAEYSENAADEDAIYYGGA
jgi:hypothetical protein